VSAVRFIVADEPWMAKAACYGANPAIFFPEAGDHGRQAKAVCARCPVAIKCLDYALAHTGPLGGCSPHTTDHGIYGGTTPHERDRIRKQRGLT
jgi:WhiB family transcriptional regulator, redox-sensing transcriptional regulator